jgi:hypothetical protein
MGHGGLGLLLVTFPAAVLVFYAWHAWFKRPLLELLPAAHRGRLRPLAAQPLPRTFGAWALAVVSLLVGIVSHLAFDACTHRGGRVVQHVAWLRATVLDTPWYTVRVYDVLQAGSSIVMAAVLAWQYWRWFRRQAPAAPLREFLDVREQARPVAILGACAAAAALYHAWSAVPVIGDVDALRSFSGRFLVGAMTIFGVEVLLWSLAVAGRRLARVDTEH